MPTAKHWDTPKELIRDLVSCDWEAWFDKTRSAGKASDFESIVQHSVGRSTFRAFRKKGGHSPSDVFRSWARTMLQQGGFERFRRIKAQSEYDEWLLRARGDFEKHWNGKLNPIYYGASLKLPNLLFKHMLASPEISEPEFQKLSPLLHVPLDKYTILAFRHFSETFPEGTCLGPIPLSAGMGFIRDEIRYKSFQQAIRTIASKAQNRPPIAFDILVWNNAH